MVGAGRRLATDDTVIRASAVHAMYEGPATAVGAAAAGGRSAVVSAVDMTDHFCCRHRQLQRQKIVREGGGEDITPLG
jgi:hypothetical protein